MLTSLLLAASLCGTDPDIVFAEGHPPWTGGGVRNRQSVATPVRSAEIERQDVREPLVVRGQTVSDGVSESSWTPGVDSFWKHPAIQEFHAAMDPFGPLEFVTLANYYDPFGLQMGTSSTGPQGYRLGWLTYNDITVLPTAPAHGTTGNFKIVEWNSNVKYSRLIQPGVLFNGTGWFNARWWDGPGGTDLPGQVDQVSTDLELGFFNDGPWSGQIAFHPQIVETYESKLDRNAFNFDGRAIATYKASPEWSFVGGVAIWDRVSTLIVPHVGVIWTPNDRWELRVLFPRSRVSYFLGRRGNADFWLYGQAEYTAEAWQAINDHPRTSDRVQLTDDRISLGLRWDTGRYSFFTEGGYVFNRQVKFASSTPAFDPGDTGLIRVGVRY
jgi:hypothetical protein